MILDTAIRPAWGVARERDALNQPIILTQLLASRPLRILSHSGFDNRETEAGAVHEVGQAKRGLGHVVHDLV